MFIIVLFFSWASGSFILCLLGVPEVALTYEVASKYVVFFLCSKIQSFRFANSEVPNHTCPVAWIQLVVSILGLSLLPPKCLFDNVSRFEDLNFTFEGDRERDSISQIFFF